MVRAAAAADAVTSWMLVPLGPLSLGLLHQVPLLLEPLGITLSHRVDDGDDKVADHDQHQLLKQPGKPVVILESNSDGGLFFNINAK